MQTLRISGNSWHVAVVKALLFSLGILAVAAEVTEDSSDNDPVGDLSSGRRDSIRNNYPNRLNSRMDSQFEYPVHGSRRPFDEDDESGPHNPEFSPQYPRRPDADFRDVDQQMRRKACKRQIKLENGIVQLRKQGALVRFRCRRGFSLVGPTVAVCNEGKWSEEPPICVKSGCIQPRLPFGLTGTTLFDGALWTFHCQFPGYVLVGSKLLVCNGRKWNATIPSCIPRIRLIPTTPTATSTTTTTTAAQVTEQDPYDTTSTTDDMDLDKNWPTAWPTFPPIVDPTTSEPSGGQEEEKNPVTIQQHDTVSSIPKIVITTIPTEVPEVAIVSTTNIAHAQPRVTVVSPSDREHYTTAAIHNVKNMTDQVSVTEIHVQAVLLTTTSHPPISAFTTVSTTHSTTKILPPATHPLSTSSEDSVIKVSTPTLTTLATPTTYTTTTTTSTTSRKTFATRIPFTRRTTPRRIPYSPFLPRPRPWTPKPTPPPSSIEDCIRRFSGRKLQYCFNRVSILQNRNRTTRNWMKRSTSPPFVSIPTARSDAKAFATSSSTTPAMNVATNTIPVTVQTTDIQPKLLETITMTPSTQSSNANEAGNEAGKSTNIEFISPIHWHKIAAENIPQTEIVNPNGASSDRGTSTVKIVSIIVVIAILIVVVGIGVRRYWRRHAGIAHPSPHEMDCRRLSVNHDVEDEFVYISGSSAQTLT